MKIHTENLTKEQRIGFTAIDDNRYNLLACPRQKGMTTLLFSYALEQAMNQADQTVLHCSLYPQTSKNLHNILDEMLYDLPYGFVKHFILKRNRECIEFANGSMIRVIPGTNRMAALRGHSASHVIIDDADKVDDLHRIMEEVFPCIATSKGGKVTIGATSPSMLSQFSALWLKSSMGETDFKLTSLS